MDVLSKETFITTVGVLNRTIWKQTNDFPRGVIKGIPKPVFVWRECTNVDRVLPEIMRRPSTFMEKPVPLKMGMVVSIWLECMPVDLV